MKKQMYSLLAVGALLAFASPVYAGEPMQASSTQQPIALSSTQMDGVTAGGVGIANAAALALGEVTADTLTLTSTNVSKVGPQIAIGQAFSQALAAGGFLFQAGAVAHSDTAASLP
jgi:thiazole synthase ThiGH ThiG subunit